MEKERQYSAFRDIGIDRRPFSDDLCMRLCVIEIGFNKLLIYVGVRLFKALLFVLVRIAIPVLGT